MLCNDPSWRINLRRVVFFFFLLGHKKKQNNLLLTFQEETSVMIWRNTSFCQCRWATSFSLLRWLLAFFTPASICGPLALLPWRRGSIPHWYKFGKFYDISLWLWNWLVQIEDLRYTDLANSWCLSFHLDELNDASFTGIMNMCLCHILSSFRTRNWEYLSDIIIYFLLC